jgi:predicted ribosome quality control (RQC) complex YloA/Tae2 family protein
LKKRIRQTVSYLTLNFEKLEELEAARKNEEIGHILMANLHRIPERSEKVELDDFYTDQLITISLKKDLSPQKNAERYYRKAKNEKLEQDKLLESLDARESELQEDKLHLETIELIDDLRELRAYIKKEGLKETPVAATPAELFKKVEFLGYTIFIGRNAKNNDLLTKKYAHKDDLWLHARDVSGSHVVIKRIVGRPFPANVIERAAELAAWYSKRKTDSLCPVIVTPKKFVRKPKGLPEGACCNGCSEGRMTVRAEVNLVN